MLSALLLLLLLLACSSHARQLPAPSASGPSWSSIAIGGGGYVLQTYSHPLTGHFYMRTDVGGVYLRSSTPSPLTPGVPFAWTPLLEWVSPAQSEFYSASALALDPADGAVVYLLTGSYWAYSNCSVLASRDAGATWSITPAEQGWGLRCGGNEGDRAVGDRMAVHPTLPATIAVGGSDGRVHLTTSAFAAAPVPVALPPPAQAAPCQPDRNASCTVRTVLWLRPDAATTLLLAAVPALGLFASPGPDYTDPATWAYVKNSGQPAEINRLLAVPSASGSSSSGSLWASAQSGGLWAGTVAGDGAGGWAVQWTVPGALADAGVPFSGLAVAPGGSQVTAMSFEYNSNTSLWHSADSGASWERLNWTMASSVPWWISYSLALNAASSLSYESSSGLLWATDFFGVYYAPLNSSSSSSSSALAFTSAEAGHEEVCLNVLRAPAVGWPVSGSADVGGFVHSAGLGAYPPRAMAAADGWAHNCLFDAAFTATVAPSGATQDALWVTAGDEYGSCHGSPSWCGLHSWVGVSRDGGATFADTTWDSAYAVSQANPYRVAVHPSDGARALVAARTGLPLSFTRDWGVTWGNATGPGGAPLASTGVQGNFWFAQPLARENNDAAAASSEAEATFYYYNGTTTLFTSRDSGATFTPTYSQFPEWNVPLFGLATPPPGAAAAGDVWAFAGWKLYHSTNAGVNFSQVWQVYSLDRALAVGPLPAVPGERSAGELALACAARAQAAQAGLAGSSPRPLPRRLPSGAAPAYAVYVVGPKDYEREGLYGSVDFGATWIPLAGANSSTPLQGLGDTPYVLEASLQQPGVLLVGTEGRGGYVRNCTEDLVRALLACGQ